jgi:hypothetical protein
MRPSRLVATGSLLALAAAVVFGRGCTCQRSGSSGESSDPAGSTTGAAADAETDALRLTSPIGATYLPGGGVVVAGLAPLRTALVATRLDPGDKPDKPDRVAWSREVLGGVGGAPDADLHLFPAPDGFALVWWGPRSGKNARHMVLVGAAGDLKGEPADIGGVACATADGVAWFEAGPTRTLVRARGWTDGAPHEVSSLMPEREPLLACGVHRIFALGEGEDDLAIAPTGDAAAATTLILEKDFGGDEEREHDEYTMGDDLGVIRLGASGAVSLRELRGAKLGPWKKLATHIEREEDVVAVDADARSAVIVYTREASTPCADGSAATTLRAIRVDRSTWAETAFELAPAACGKDPGPFFTGALDVGLVVAWAERGVKRGPGGAPVESLGYRVIAAAGPAPLVRLPVTADLLVDAACDGKKCYAVAVSRVPGSEEVAPERARILAYP